MARLNRLNKEDLMKAVRQAGISSQVEAASVLNVFQEEVLNVCGADLAGQVRPLFFRRSVLTVAAVSSLIAQEIGFQEKSLLMAINRRLKDLRVERIAWRIG